MTEPTVNSRQIEQRATRLDLTRVLRDVRKSVENSHELIRASEQLIGDTALLK